MQDINKEAYIVKMAENLPVLRAKFGLTQEQLGTKIDLSRQSVVAIETGRRRMSWAVFIALLMIFKSNKITYPLLNLFGIYTEELDDFFLESSFR